MWIKALGLATVAMVEALITRCREDTDAELAAVKGLAQDAIEHASAQEKRVNLAQAADKRLFDEAFRRLEETEQRLAAQAQRIDAVVELLERFHPELQSREYYTPDEMSRRLGISRDTVYQRIRDGAYPGSYKDEQGLWQVKNPDWGKDKAL